MALADPIELVETLRSCPAETEWFEFKRGHFDPEDFGEYVSALANSAMLHSKPRAYLLFGIEDRTHAVLGTDVRLATEKVGNEIFEHWLSRFLNPKINVSFEHCYIDGKRIEIAVIEPAYDRPVLFRNVSFIRIGSIKKRLVEYPQKEQTLWQLTSRYSFEEGIADTHVSAEQISKRFMCETLCNLLYGPTELSQENMIANFIGDGLIVDDLQGGYDITNLFALLGAKRITEFRTVAHKAPRIITYKLNSKLVGEGDQTGVYGYAVAFQRMLAYILDKTGGKEVMLHGIRKMQHTYPEKAIRELLANALIHQDLSDSGQPKVEIFADKIQFTNPGTSLVSLDRIIDAPAKSRNERLSKLMRKARLCEARGSGVDRAIWAIEEAMQAPPLFVEVEGSTVVTIFKTTTFAAMSKDDRIRACYQHATVSFLNGSPMQNGTLRARLGLNKNQYQQVTNVINDAQTAGAIKPLDADQGNRTAKYIPWWA